MHSVTQEVAKNTNTHVYSDLWLGTVVSTDPATNVVIVAPDGEGNHNLLQGIPMASAVCAALGFNETVLPTVGTRCLCHGRSGKKTIILGCLPHFESQTDSNSTGLPAKAILGVRDAVFDSVHKNGYNNDLNKSVIVNNFSPTDTLQGEKVISNEFGVMLGLFKLMATLKATELSQVQCHFLDDLVRIVSHNFEHYTSLGQVKVYHDGKAINMEVGATHSPLESVGFATEPAIERIENTNDPNNQYYKLQEEQSTMIERMKLFVGKLGDFINLMLVKPADENRALGKDWDGTPDTGLLQIRAALDGALVVRSASGIYLEKTNWIRVPHRIRTPEDPTGDDGVNIEYKKREAYKFDEKYTYREIAFLYYLQMRDYLAYINEDMAYAGFNKHTKDFYVNDDIDNETQLDQITYIDPETNATFKRTKSWISLMNNGGVSFADAWGSCIAMEGGNIYIQPAKDLILQPNRNVVGKIGGNIAIAARKEIDLSSTEGGMRVKTHNAQHLYSSDSGIIIQADGAPFNEGIIPFPGTEMPVNVSGVVIAAPKSSVTTYSSAIYERATDIYAVDTKAIIAHAEQELLLLSDEQLLIGSRFAEIVTEGEFIAYSEGSAIMLGLNQTVVGKKGQYFGEVELLGQGIPVSGIFDPDTNDNKAFFDNLHQLYTRTNEFDFSDYVTSFKDPEDLKNIVFEFPPSDVYQLTDADVIPQTLSQQNDAIHQLYGFEDWTEESINDSYPYPGADRANTLATVVVNNVEDDANLVNKTTELLNQSTIELVNVFENYKVM